MENKMTIMPTPAAFKDLEAPRGAPLLTQTSLEGLRPFHSMLPMDYSRDPLIRMVGRSYLFSIMPTVNRGRTQVSDRKRTLTVES